MTAKDGSTVSPNSPENLFWLKCFELSQYSDPKMSDGKEVIVDNKFLKVNNPLLLINFYEEHLRYNPKQ